MANEPTTPGQALAGLILIAAVIWFVATQCHGSTSESQVTGRVVDYQAVDAGHLQVTVELMNQGSETATANCTVSATTPYGDMGFDYLAGESLGPGETKTGTVGLVIQNDAAALVNQVEVKDC